MKKMRYRFLLPLLITVLVFSCKKYETPAPPKDPPTNPVQGVLLKDIVIPLLPSPYYHFEYSADNKPSAASFASGLYIYDVVYNENRISEMKSSMPLINFRLQYTYDNTGKVSMISYINAGGELYRKDLFTYHEQKLFKVERQVKTDSGFIAEKKTFFNYGPDGNLLEKLVHRLPIPAAGQTESFYSDWFDQYDDKISTDDFSLLHDNFFDHLVLLPGVQFRKNNPLRLTHIGDDVNYKIDYSYTYNDKDAPLIKTGNLLWLSGADSGKRFEEKTFYSYY
jgi:hypothetical protein